MSNQKYSFSTQLYDFIIVIVTERFSYNFAEKKSNSINKLYTSRILGKWTIR